MKKINLIEKPSIDTEVTITKLFSLYEYLTENMLNYVNKSGVIIDNVGDGDGDFEIKFIRESFYFPRYSFKIKNDIDCININSFYKNKKVYIGIKPILFDSDILNEIAENVNCNYETYNETDYMEIYKKIVTVVDIIKYKNSDNQIEIYIMVNYNDINYIVPYTLCFETAPTYFPNKLSFE
jgi:hypothetical protein